MQSVVRSFALLALAAGLADAGGATPIGKVLQLLSDLQHKILADGVEALKVSDAVGPGPEKAANLAPAGRATSCPPAAAPNSDGAGAAPPLFLRRLLQPPPSVGLASASASLPLLRQANTVDTI